jgi:uncharacterized cupredoxin-like copper-binding protein
MRGQQFGVPIVCMETTTQEHIDYEESIDQTLRSIEVELARQGAQSRRFHGNVMFFGGMLALISLASLVAVAAKLGTKDIEVTTKAAPAASAPATKAAPAPALPKSSNVTLKEFTLTPQHPTMAAGKVTFNVTNNGNLTHEFVVLKTDQPAGSLLKGGRADESGNVGELGDLAPGKSKALSLLLKPGHYALICNLPGHYKAGQYADLNVR